MRKTINNNQGVILLTVLIICSILITVSTAVLSTAVMDYKMKKVNSKVKKALYYAEAGLEESYAIATIFLSSAIDCLMDNSFPDFNAGLSEIIDGGSFDCCDETCLKDALENMDNYIIYDGNYPLIRADMVKDGDSFVIKATSTYRNGKIEKIASLSYRIDLSNEEVSLYSRTPINLIKDVYWDIER